MGIVFTTSFVRGSISEIVLSPPFATQTEPPPVAAGAAAWSPDGRKLAFSQSLGAWERGSSEIFVANTDGSGLRRLTRRPGHDYGPVWSPALTG